MITLTNYIGAWLAHRETKGLLTAVSARQYEVTFRRHVVPFIGETPIGDVTVSVAQRLMSDLVGNTLLAMRTVRMVRARLKTVLDDAVRSGLLKANPLDVVDLGQQKPSAVQTLSEGQLKQLLTYVRRHHLGPIIRLAVSTGLSRSELGGLRWGNVDLQNRRLNLMRGRQPKARWVPLTEDMADELGRMHVHAARYAALGGHDLDRLHVLRTQAGQPWSLSGLSNRIRGLFKDADLDGFHLQDLRHSHAIALLRSRRSMKEVGELMGMAGRRSARNVYGHNRLDPDEAP